MEKKRLYDTAPKAETAVLVALITDAQNAEQTRVYLDELAFLASTLNIHVVKAFTQRYSRPDKRTFIGKGKLEEIVAFAKANEVDNIIFEDDLSPAQVRNLETEFNGQIIEKARHKILDRSLLILDIFSLRAQTAQAKAQVELAQYQYMLPRLTRMWTHLSKQQGGIGMRGPGEKELETDRRIVRDKISLLKKQLEKFDQQSRTRRQARTQVVRVCLVGYTNVGKSTVMRLLARADEVQPEDKLFATVDSTVRKVVLHNIPFLLTDTVGFIRKLPTLLIESFKSTLDEIVEADLLIHVVDLSSANYEEQIATVNQTLLEIGANDKPTVLALNKIDRLPAEQRRQMPAFDFPNTQVVHISATAQENIEFLRDALFHLVADKYYTIFPNYMGKPLENPNFE